MNCFAEALLKILGTLRGRKGLIAYYLGAGSTLRTV